MPRTRLAQVLDVRDGRGQLGVGHQPVEEGEVELDVDEPGALGLELVRHAARAADHHPLAALVRLDRPADGLAQPVAAPARGRRVLHDVDQQGTTRHGHASGSRT